MKKKLVVSFVTVLLLVISSCSMWTGNEMNSMSRLLIPDGAIIVSAELHLYAVISNTESIDVNVHRITSPWEELSVTWSNFDGAYDPVALSGTTIEITDWVSLDIKPYIMGWIDGVHPNNFGLLLDQDISEDYTKYISREYTDPNFQPYIQITYMIEGNLLTDDAEAITADTYIWEISPDLNAGLSTILYTGQINGGEKQTLIKFDLDMEEPGDFIGTGTPGYWKNHPEAWPVDEIVIGGIVYSKSDAIDEMSLPIKKDKWYTMFKALAAAKLNILNGASDESIAHIITAADEWMYINHHLIGGKLVIIAAKSDTWKEGEEYYNLLDAYNNGLLEGAPSRDTLE